MSANSKVVWSEGLFLQQQHFQQQDRYLERYVESRCEALVPYGWGFAELELEQDLLGIGKLSIRRGIGVYPDGTPFRIPDDDPLPVPLDVGPETRDQIVYLALPVRRSDTPEVTRPGEPDGLSRHVSQEYEARDSSSPSGETATLSVGPLRTRLLLASERHRGLRVRAAGPHSRVPPGQARAFGRGVHADRAADARRHAARHVHFRTSSGSCISAARRWRAAPLRRREVPRPRSRST